jgi:hypothetical protein
MQSNLLPAGGPYQKFPSPVCSLIGTQRHATHGSPDLQTRRRRSPERTRDGSSESRHPRSQKSGGLPIVGPCVRHPGYPRESIPKPGAPLLRTAKNGAPRSHPGQPKNPSSLSQRRSVASSQRLRRCPARAPLRRCFRRPDRLYRSGGSAIPGFAWELDRGCPRCC